MRSYRITDGARAEFLAAFDYYTDHGGPEVAIRFLETYERTRDRLLQFPRIGKKERGDIRTFSIKPYPYSIFYLFEDDCIYIVTIAHHSRGPEYLDDRLKEFT